MDRTFELEIVDQLLDMLENPKGQWSDSVYELPVENYTSEARQAQERERIFGQIPLLAGLSGELPDVGSWKLFDETGTPILLMRGEDLTVRGFLNVCRHRGARIVEDRRGTGRRLSCPFHAWSYNTDGSLVGVPERDAFAGLDREKRGLVPLQVREHVGAIWVVPNPVAPEMDLDTHLGPFAAELARCDLGRLHFAETRVHHIKANWKVAMDTFTEGYHIPVLHKDTLSPRGVGSVNLYTPFGDHHRQVFPIRGIEELRGQDRGQWRAFDEWRFALTYIVYPNATISYFGDHAEMWQNFPGATVDTSVCLHSYFTHEPARDDSEREQYDQVFTWFFDLLENEDFRVSSGLERGLRSGANSTHVLGRNEQATQGIHRAYQRDLERCPVTADPAR